MQEKNMSIAGHLTELRSRLIKILIGLIFTFIIGLFMSKPVILYLQNSEQAHLTMNAFRISDPFNVFLQFAFIIGIVLISPVILYQLWAFISPGLHEQERKITLSYIPLAVILFLLGIAFSYFILFPFVLRFMTNLSHSLNINNVIGINEYFNFLIQITIPFGILFQMPILVMFLTRLGIITPKVLKDIRKYAYFILIVIAGIITPPELISQLMVTVPLIILYEISVMISKRAYNKSSKRREDHDHY